VQKIAKLSIIQPGIAGFRSNMPDKLFVWAISLVKALPTTEPPNYPLKPSCFSYWQLLQLQEVDEVDSWTSSTTM